MAEQGVLQTLERGLVALRAVAERAEGLRIAEIAERLGTHRAIAYRIVNTLAAQDMVRRLEDGRVVLGSGALLLGLRAEGLLRMHARPVLDALAERLGATAYLSVAEGGDGVALLTAEPREAFLNIHYRVGSRHPLTRGAAGLAILAGRPEGPDDPDPVRRARALGYSITKGELQRGAVGVAAPVAVPPEAVPALECSLGVVALEGFDTASAAKAVRAAAHDLAAALGGA